MSGVSICRVGGWEGGAWWLPAGGIRASQGTFSFSSLKIKLKFCYIHG